MAIPEEIQRQVLEEATSATPNYDIDYSDERFGKVESDKSQALTELEQTYGGMIGSTDKYFEDQIQASKDWADKQSQIQQENTDFAIEQIEQQKAQANKDYQKEQSGAYVDWRKQSNQYGTEAEKMASAGLANTGFSESSQVSMYNTYQNRVATARESFNNAVLNYNNAIKDAQLQNNAALAEIAYQSLQQQLELSLQGFQYKNQLILEQANKKTELENIYYNRYQDVLQQINTENALKEDIRQYTETQKWQTEQAELDRQHQLERDRINNEFAEKLEGIKHQYELKLLDAKTEKEKELAKQEHELEMKKLAQEQANALARIAKEYEEKKKYEQSSAVITGGSSGGSSGSKISSSSSSTQNAQSLINNVANIQAQKNGAFSGSTYDEAVSYLTKYGVPNSRASAAMTASEWQRRRSSYNSTGTGAYEVKNFSTYKEYLQYYVKYCMENYAK